MKKVMYAVKGADGQVFNTASYNEAKADGNEIIATAYETIEEEYVKIANEMLIKARRKAQGRGLTKPLPYDIISITNEKER